jgi:inorganic pyrophosphatase
VDRLRHYFLTYKQGPDRAAHAVEITHVYGRDEAHDVIRRSAQDYEAHLADGTIGRR